MPEFCGRLLGMTVYFALAQVHSKAVPFRLHVVYGRRAPVVPRSQSPGTLKAERKRQADEVRRMKQTTHEEVSRTTVVPRRRSSRDLAEVSRRGPRRATGDVAVWLASLQSVATEHRRAKAEERAAALRETVRLQREARQDAQMVASSELDRLRMRSSFAEQKDRRAVTSALERQANARRQDAASCLEARRRAAEHTSARRENAAFADDVARRIGACSKAHVRFVQQEHQEFRRQLAATEIQRQRNERRRRDAELERVVEARRKAVATRAESDRLVTRHAIENFVQPVTLKRNRTFSDVSAAPRYRGRVEGGGLCEQLGQVVCAQDHCKSNQLISLKLGVIILCLPIGRTD